MFMGDIGQGAVEEVNLGVPGANYGWRLREGTFATGYAVGPGRPGRLYPRPAQAGSMPSSPRFASEVRAVTSIPSPRPPA